MKALGSRLTAVAIAFAATFTSLTPVQAFQMPSPPVIGAAADVTNVQYSNRDRRDWRRDNNRREMRRDMRRDDRRAGWYNGHRGYRERRPGYRYYNGYWFPLAAFGAGAIIGGAIANDRGGYSSRHIAWCESRYRSYRASDNTYVPRAGVRARCVSPYS